LATGPLYEKSLSNLAEVEARDGTVVVVTNSLEYVKQHEDALYVSTSSDWTAPLVLNVVLQLVAYYIAKERGCPIDQPRNLAKSVTVE
jgi:glucosamine--fructose-6-phosphate aminotransferase (isomerizing)